MNDATDFEMCKYCCVETRFPCRSTREMEDSGQERCHDALTMMGGGERSAPLPPSATAMNDNPKAAAMIEALLNARERIVRADIARKSNGFIMPSTVTFPAEELSALRHHLAHTITNPSQFAPPRMLPPEPVRGRCMTHGLFESVTGLCPKCHDTDPVVIHAPLPERTGYTPPGFITPAIVALGDRIRGACIAADVSVIKTANSRFNQGMTPSLALARALVLNAQTLGQAVEHSMLNAARPGPRHYRAAMSALLYLTVLGIAVYSFAPLDDLFGGHVHAWLHSVFGS